MIAYPHNSETLSRYLADISKHPMLAVGGDAYASREELIISNLRLVVTIAKKYAKYVEELLDFIQDGNTGLVIAADRYDPGKGSFSNYAAYHIKNCIIEGQIVMARTVRLPRTAFKNYTQIKVMHEKGCKPERIAAALGLDVYAVKRTLEYAEEKSDYSAEEKGGVRAGKHGATSLHREIENPEDLPVEDAGEAHLAVKRMHRLLTAKQRQVIQKRLEGFTFKEIGEETRTTHQAVMMLEKAALSRLAI